MSFVAGSPESDHPPCKGCVFLSLRFGGNAKELVRKAQMLRDGLEQMGWEVFLCDVNVGGNFGEEIVSALSRMVCLVAFISSEPPYGANCGGKYTTYYELKYAYEHNKLIIPLIMDEGVDWPPSYSMGDDGKGLDLLSAALSPAMAYVDCKTEFDVDWMTAKICKSCDMMQRKRKGNDFEGKRGCDTKKARLPECSPAPGNQPKTLSPRPSPQPISSQPRGIPTAALRPQESSAVPSPQPSFASSSLFGVAIGVAFVAVGCVVLGAGGSGHVSNSYKPNACKLASLSPGGWNGCRKCADGGC